MLTMTLDELATRRAAKRARAAVRKSLLVTRRRARRLRSAEKLAALAWEA